MAKNVLRTSVSLNEEDMRALEKIRENMIEPLFGEHNQTQAISYCIRFTLVNGVVDKAKVKQSA